MQVRRTNTILYCSRWEQTLGFYRDVLEFQVALDRGWFVEFRIGPDSFVSIADAAHATVPAGNGAGLTLSWQVDDVGTARTALVDRLVDCSPITARWGSDSTFLHDPEGNRIELWTPAD